ncbi:MAG: cupin domain-containing protein [Cytophagaceae bacterium]|nr:cupin domain-containing protein [Cytophagaceae bacterium]
MNTLVKDSDIEWSELGGGIKRKIMAYDAQMMVVKVAFEAGGVGASHSHPHTQASYVSKGVFEITIDGKTQTLIAGDVYFVPSGLIHGAFCIEAGELIDVFNPMREDFL